MEEYALIVAGGAGIRMNAGLPKQFLEIKGSPLLMHTIRRFHDYSPQIKINVVLPEDQLNQWEELCLRYDFRVPVQLIKGGKTRFQSVKNGLSAINGEGLVAIHDGVRPFISREIIAASFNLAAEHGSAVCSVRLKESIRVIDKDSTKSLDRSRYRLIQTPQTFRISLIKAAYELEENETLTDDASVAERAGCKISLFEGSFQNIKITTPEDLLIAEVFARDFL
jgi:2-C-methyl-D-erythritol 4-phosphate cytidylyltransferase